jgi:hypothetical protein
VPAEYKRFGCREDYCQHNILIKSDIRHQLFENSLWGLLYILALLYIIVDWHCRKSLDSARGYISVVRYSCIEVEIIIWYQEREIRARREKGKEGGE